MTAQLFPRVSLRSRGIPLVTLTLLLVVYLACFSRYTSPSRATTSPDGLAAGTDDSPSQAISSHAAPLSYPSIDPLTGDNVPWPPKRLPYIPSKIWQIYLGMDLATLSFEYLQSWISLSPSHTYTVINDESAHELIASMLGPGAGEHHTPDALGLYYMISRQVMRVDFLRYLLLAVYGGVYSDTDTKLVKPIYEWVPETFRDHTRVIIGIEADQIPPVDGTFYEVQFCQWTLAGAPDHPLYWTMVDRILGRIRQSTNQALKRAGITAETVELHNQDIADKVTLHFSDFDILDITGPAGWSRLIYEFLTNVTGTQVTWHNFTGMTEPRLIDDILILPIDGFATGVPHSNASQDPGAGTMAQHMFSGSWKGIDG